jgi:hypothetical protein
VSTRPGLLLRRPVERGVSASVETDARLLPEDRAPEAYSHSVRSGATRPPAAARDGTPLSTGRLRMSHRFVGLRPMAGQWRKRAVGANVSNPLRRFHEPGARSRCKRVEPVGGSAQSVQTCRTRCDGFTKRSLLRHFPWARWMAHRREVAYGIDRNARCPFRVVRRSDRRASVLARQRRLKVSASGRAARIGARWSAVSRVRSAMDDSVSTAVLQSWRG